MPSACVKYNINELRMGGWGLGLVWARIIIITIIIIMNRFV